jgi:hypothetical protein
LFLRFFQNNGLFILLKKQYSGMRRSLRRKGD